MRENTKEKEKKKNTPPKELTSTNELHQQCLQQHKKNARNTTFTALLCSIVSPTPPFPSHDINAKILYNTQPSPLLRCYSHPNENNTTYSLQHSTSTFVSLL